MSSPGFQSDSAAMTRAVQGFEETANNARQTMSSLEQELTSTLAQYQGDQATAFWGLHTKLQEDMQAASKELDTMSTLVNQSYHNYGSGDAETHQSFTSVANQAAAGGQVLSRLVGGSAH